MRQAGRRSIWGAEKGGRRRRICPAAAGAGPGCRHEGGLGRTVFALASQSSHDAEQLAMSTVSRVKHFIIIVGKQ